MLDSASDGSWALLSQGEAEAVSEAGQLALLTETKHFEAQPHDSEGRQRVDEARRR